MFLTFVLLYVVTIDRNGSFRHQKRLLIVYPRSYGTVYRECFNNVINALTTLQAINTLVMAALRSRYIIFLPCGFFFLSSFFPRLISAVADWMSTVLPHMV